MKLSDKSVCQDHIYKKIYNDNASNLHHYIYYKCGNSDKAADIVQEAFIKLWHNCAKVPVEKATSFLYKVTNNLFLNDVAHEKVKLKYQEEKKHIATSTDNDFTEENPDEVFMKQLEGAIQNLSEAQREAFLMNRIEGKKYAEIAEILGISVKAVEKRIGKALQSLRNQLK